MTRRFNWRGVTLGDRLSDDDDEKIDFETHRKYLHSLETDTEYNGICFEGRAHTTNDDDDGQFDADKLEAIRRNHHVTALAFDHTMMDLPLQWTATMLREDRLTELRIQSIFPTSITDSCILLKGLQSTHSLKKLVIEYAGQHEHIMSALALAFAAGQLNLTSLHVIKISQFGYNTLVPMLRNCTSLEELHLTQGRKVHLDSRIDELVHALCNCTPNLKTLSLGYGSSSFESFTKLVNAIATKNLEFISIGASEHQQVLVDTNRLERMIAANRTLESFNIVNIETLDMSRMFASLTHNHGSLKKILLTNVIKTSRNAADLGAALARNDAPVEELEIANVYNAGKFEHSAVVLGLSKTLKSNTTLTKLHFHLNEVHNDDLAGLASIIDGASNNSSIKYVYMDEMRGRRDSCTEQGMVRLGQALSRNQGLVSLRLKWKRNFGDAAIRALLQGAKNNPTLQWVDLPKDWLSPQQGAELDYYLELNMGVKQSIHAPLNVMPFCFVRADSCRRRGGGSGMPPEVATHYDSQAELVSSIHTVAMRRHGRRGPPNILYYLVKERVDLFQEAAAVARRRSVNQGQSVTVVEHGDHEEGMAAE